MWLVATTDIVVIVADIVVAETAGRYGPEDPVSQPVAANFEQPAQEHAKRDNFGTRKPIIEAESGHAPADSPARMQGAERADEGAEGDARED